MEPTIEYSGHILLVCVLAWGYLRSLCALVPKIVKERSDVVITFMVAGGFGQKVEHEISRYFSGSVNEFNLKESIRVVNLGGEGVESFKLRPFLSKNFPAYYAKFLNCEPIQCLSSRKAFAAIREPTIAVIDVSSALLHKYGGMGDVAAKARAQADTTEGDVKAIASQFYRPSEGKFVTVSGIPAMYDYEFSPQEPREDVPQDDLFEIAYKFAQECDGFLAVSNTAYEPESLDGMRTWLSETNRSIYAIGPLTPIDSLSESSKKQEIEASANGDEFQVFLDRQLLKYGDKSIICVRQPLFSVWWSKNEYVRIFVDVLLQFGIPFVSQPKLNQAVFLTNQLVSDIIPPYDASTQDSRSGLKNLD
ncbi:glycosyltransferase family 1 protein [Ramaria rubella]|nr:glycosyltransferase family 1 protein [Ramaria rubella]